MDRVWIGYGLGYGLGMVYDTVCLVAKVRKPLESS